MDLECNISLAVPEQDLFCYLKRGRTEIPHGDIPRPNLLEQVLVT